MKVRNCRKEDCRYNIGCNNAKKSPTEISPLCEGDNESAYNILKCDKNNKSRACPVMMCNFEKQNQQNRDIFLRNFPDKLITPVKNYRAGFEICRKNINLNKNNDDLQINLSKKITNFNNLKTDFIPGKGKGSEFLRFIDVDTELKCVNNKNTLCPNKKYIPNTGCRDIKYNNPNLLENPYCELYKKFGYSNPTKSYKTKCGKKPIVVDRCGFKIDCCPNKRDKQLVDMNYNICTYSLKENKNCLVNNIKKRCNPQMPYKQPILFQYNDDICYNNSLQVGPERKPHKCENLWNNLTRRSSI